MHTPEGYVPTERVRNLLRERGYTFRAQSRKGRAMIWRHPETGHYANLPRKDLMAVAEVRTMLANVGLTADEINRFLGACRS